MTETKADIGAVERSGATDGDTRSKADIGAVERQEAGGGGGLSIPIAMRHYLQMAGVG